MARRATRKRIITGWNCDPDIMERLERIPNRSRFINRILREYFRMPRATEAEEEKMGSNQRIKNLDMILSYMAVHKYSQRGPIERRIQLECGVTAKKAEEYIDLLALDGQLVRSGQYIVLGGWKPEGYPYPGTEAFVRWKCERELESFNKKFAEKKESGKLDADEEAILDTEINHPRNPAKCGHNNKPFLCKVCQGATCADCASSSEQAGGTPSGTCRVCGG